MKLSALFVFIFSTILAVESSQDELSKKSFPKGFLLGVASSAYQIEGAWNVSGKGQNTWDHYLHAYPHLVADKSNGDIACDSYHKFKEDVALLKELGVDFYRFSLSWARILPLGYAHQINPDGIRYYNELIDELLKNGIKPVVTLYHWDLPLSLQKIGGWTNKIITGVFTDYARIAFENFGDRVQYWITINSACAGYADEDSPPIINQPGIGEYMCIHMQLLAHAKAYRMYDQDFRSSQKGKIGFVIDPRWFHPKTDSEEDIAATERARQFSIGWLAHPLFSKTGDYPQVMKDRIAVRSKLEGFPKSRLPEFTSDEIQMVRGASDFLGANIYTTYLTSHEPDASIGTPSQLKDISVKVTQDPKWPKSKADWLMVVPSGVRTLMRWLKEQYDNPPIFITENGYGDDGTLDDLDRINYYQMYLSEVLEAIHEDQANIIAYTAWSLLDNFEWTAGYMHKFGLYHVDFTDPNRARKAKLSAKFLKEVIRQRKLVTEIIKEEL